MTLAPQTMEAQVNVWKPKLKIELVIKKQQCKKMINTHKNL